MLLAVGQLFAGRLLLWPMPVRVGKNRLFLSYFRFGATLVIGEI
jgi:hypothetical protein